MPAQSSSVEQPPWGAGSAAAWQLHVSRIEEQLNAGWREQIERVFRLGGRMLASGMMARRAAETKE